MGCVPRGGGEPPDNDFALIRYQTFCNVAERHLVNICPLGYILVAGGCEEDAEGSRTPTDPRALRAFACVGGAVAG